MHDVEIIFWALNVGTCVVAFCSEERSERLAMLRNHVGTKSSALEMSRVRAPRKGGKRHHNVANGNGSLWISSQGDGDSENCNADGLKRFRPKVNSVKILLESCYHFDDENV